MRREVNSSRSDISRRHEIICVYIKFSMQLESQIQTFIRISGFLYVIGQN